MIKLNIKHSKQLSTLFRNNKNGRAIVAKQLKLLYAIRNKLSGEGISIRDIYMYYNEVVCIRTLVRIAIFHSQLYFTTSIRILLKQTIIEHQLSLLSGLSTGVYSLYSSRLLLMITYMIVEISKSSAETKLLVGVRCRDGPQPLTKQRVWTLCKLNLRYCLPRVLDMYLFIYFLVADTDSITKSVTMYSF